MIVPLARKSVIAGIFSQPAPAYAKHERGRVFFLAREARGLPLIPSKGEYLRPWQDVDLYASMVANAYIADARREHAIGSNNYSVGAEKRDSNCHDLKMLFTFMSG